MTTTWTEFEKHFTELTKPKQPWGTPPTTDQIRAFEEAAGVSFPEDFVAYLSACDRPDSGLCAPWFFMSLEIMRSNWQTQKNLIDKGLAGSPTPDSQRDAGIKNDFYNLKWIPFIHDGSSDFHCIDLDPAPGGTLGQVISYFHDRDDRKVLAKSITEYFQTLTKEIGSGALTAAGPGEEGLVAQEGSEAARIFAW